MAKQERSAFSASRLNYWLRILHPLSWWLLLVLAMFAYRTHQKWMAQTRIEFSVSLQNQAAFDAVARLDGVPVSSLQNISLGNHNFSVSHPKGVSYQTNFFCWYGRHDFGEIKLKRTMGTLSVKAVPAASTVTITGPEFSKTLRNTSGTNLVVPTDTYTVAVQYPHWFDSKTLSVYQDTPTSFDFSPQLGALHLSCNHDGATFQLQNYSGNVSERGDLPATVLELPTWIYQLTVFYHGHQIQKSVEVRAGITNEAPVQFIFGVAQFETVPSGAEVRTGDGSYLGQTPLMVPDLPAQTAQFSLNLPGYEPLTVPLTISADQTNVCRTNLVSIAYVSAMQDARQFLAASNYAAAINAAVTALGAKPGDADAMVLQNRANGLLDAEQERQEKQRQAEQEKLRQAQERLRQQQERLARPKQTFDAVCQRFQAANLFVEHELKTGKPAKTVATAIANAMATAPAAFQILRNDSPAPETYVIVAQQTWGLGILGGSERDCIIVVGQSKDNETQVWFKVLEYAVHHTEVMVNFTLSDKKQLIPIDSSQTAMNADLQGRVQDGIKIVTDKIQSVIGQ